MHHPLPKLPGARVLLLEGSADTARLLSRFMVMWGLSPVTVSTGADVLTALRDEPFDVLLCRLGAPDIHGHDLLPMVRQTSPIPAIAMNGTGEEAFVRRSFEVGYLRHLLVPFRIEELHEAIDGVLRDRARGA